MTKIAVFVGSLREHSVNKALAKALESSAPEGVIFEYIDIRLSHYSEDIENAGIPAEIASVKKQVEAADGVLFVTPEYNRSVPGVLKNAIDWISRPFGETSFEGKPVGIVGASITPNGTALAQAHLRAIMLFQNAKVLGQPEVYVANAYEVFGENGEVVNERWRKNFNLYMVEFMSWVND